MSSPLSPSTPRAHGDAIGLFLLERAALAFGVGARRFVGGEPLAHDVRRTLEIGFDRSTGCRRRPAARPTPHARPRTPRAAARSRTSTTSVRHLRRPGRAPSADPLPCRPDRFRPARRARLGRLQQRARLLLRRLGARLLGNRRQRVVRRIRQAIDRRHRGIGMLAAQRHAFDLGGVAQALERHQPRAGFRGVTRDAAERPSRRARPQSPRGARHRDPPPSPPSRARARGRATRAPPPRSSPPRRRASTPARPAGRAHGRARCLPIRCGRCRRAPTRRRCAPRRRGARARRCRPWRTRSATRCRPDRARESLRCGCWDRGAWTWTGGGAYREFPLVFQTPAAPCGPAGAFLPVCYVR